MFKKDAKKIKPGPQPDHRQRQAILRAAIIIVVMAGLTAGGLLLYRHYHNPNSPQAQANKQGVATLDQVSNRYSSTLDKNLQSGDYQTYQIGKLELANGYITSNDYTSAQSLLQQVQQNVPKDKLESYYYQLALQIDKHFNDTADYNSDLQALVTLLKSQGLTAEAQAYQSGQVPLGNNNTPYTKMPVRPL